MVKEKIISPACSFKGWKVIEFLKGYLNIFRANWSTIKELLKVITPLVLSWFATKDPIWTVSITVIGKAVFDIMEYWVKVQKK